METYRIEVGHHHGVKPGNIVGAIANEADLESKYIGRIDIRDDHSLLDLPEGMPPELLHAPEEGARRGPAVAADAGRGMRRCRASRHAPQAASQGAAAPASGSAAVIPAWARQRFAHVHRARAAAPDAGPLMRRRVRVLVIPA